MRHYIAMLFLLFFAELSFGQVDQALKNLRLYEGSVYVTYGHRITMKFSELEYHMGVGVFPKTNVAYLNYKQLILLMQDTAKNEQWSQERYLKSRNYFYSNARGGRIVLYVERYDQYETNNKLFFVIIRNEKDEKIFEYQLPERSADFVTSDVFSNWAYIDIDKELPDEFTVYVNNKMSERLSDTKFLIQQNVAPLIKQTNE